MRLILVRHGQTPHNITGALDTARPGAALTTLGEAQAAAVPGALAGERVSAVYASPLRRTRQTAAPLADALGLPVDVREGLEEIGAGHLELSEAPDDIAAYLGCVYAWADGDLDAHLPGAADGHAFLARYDAAIAGAAAGHDDDATLVVVSHGAAIRLWTSARGGVERGFARGHRLSNTGAATLVGHPGAGWTLTGWHPTPLGGPHLASSGVHDPTGEAQAAPDLAASGRSSDEVASAATPDEASPAVAPDDEVVVPA